MTQIKKKPNRTSEIIQWWWVVLTDGAQTRIHCWTFSLMLFKFVRRLLCPQRAVSTATPRVGLLHLNSGPCSEPTEDRTTAWRGEEDAAYITSMLGALTQSMLMGSFCFFFPDVELLIWICRLHCHHHITYTLTQIQKMHYMFMYISILMTAYVLVSVKHEGVNKLWFCHRTLCCITIQQKWPCALVCYFFLNNGLHPNEI